MEKKQEVLRIHIVGHWTVDDFIRAFSAIERLYILKLLLIIEEEDVQRQVNKVSEIERRGYISYLHKLAWRATPHSLFSNDRLRHFDQVPSRNLLNPDEVLVVSKIEFASPGFADFTGVGRVMKELRLLIRDLVSLRENKKKLNLAIAKAELENKAIQIKNEGAVLENDMKRIQIAKAYMNLQDNDKTSLSEGERRQIVAAVAYEQDAIEQLVVANKIVSVEEVNSAETKGKK